MTSSVWTSQMAISPEIMTINRQCTQGDIIQTDLNEAVAAEQEHLSGEGAREDTSSDIINRYLIFLSVDLLIYNN